VKKAFSRLKRLQKLVAAPRGLAGALFMGPKENNAEQT